MSAPDAGLIARAARTLGSLLEKTRTAALATHVNPDGDGIGSEICPYPHLRSLDIEARIVNSEALPLRYRFLDPANVVEVYDAARHDAFLRAADVIFMLDNSATTRLGPLEPAIRATRAT